jgi:hypothetical protein
VRHFPGVSSNAVISRPLYCIARPLRLHRDAKVSKACSLLEENYADSSYERSPDSRRPEADGESAY